MTKEEKAAVKSPDSGKTRGSRDRHSKKDKPKPLTKVIIRRLPPTMTEEEFLKQIDPLPDHDFYYYAAADWSLGFDATCRAYITFRNHEDVFLFRDRFDGYVFVDTKGEEYQAVVEFAPFQGLPKNKARKIDPKVNTIESEPHYISFLQKLEEDREACKNECKLEFSLQPKDDKKITSTPLLQFLMSKKMERREEQKKDGRRKREEEKQRRRNRVAKNIPSAVKEEGAQPKEGKQKTEGHGDAPEEKKNSKSKRRAERDQRRREEYEQRRREREKERATAAAAAENESKGVSIADPPLGKDPEKPITIAKQTDGEGKRKEVKKYSERRERNRSKNWSNTILASDAVSAATTSPESTKPSAKPEFTASTFDSLAFVKEFVPKHKQKAAAKADADTSVNMEEVNEKLEKISLQEKKDNTDKDKEDGSTGKKSKRSERSQRNSSSSGGHANETKSEERSERRIHNKDRPSIVIYQPGKTRLRSSEDGQPITDARSNPTSDTESLKKEERPSTARKVSRYSERRSGRARDGKQKSNDDNKNAKALAESTDDKKEEKPGRASEESHQVEKSEKEKEIE